MPTKVIRCVFHYRKHRKYCFVSIRGPAYTHVKVGCLFYCVIVAGRNMTRCRCLHVSHAVHPPSHRHKMVFGTLSSGK